MQPLVLSFDLDDTLWAVEPVILAAEGAMLAWLKERHPQMMRGQDRESLRAMRARIAEQFPRAQPRHDFPAPSRLGGNVRGRQATREATPTRRLKCSIAARNRVKLYDEVAGLAQAPAARATGCLRSATATPISSAAESRTGSKATSPRSRPAPPNRTSASSRACSTQAGVEAAQVLHIGDDPHLDVMGATQAGMQAAWLNRNAKSWPAHLPPPPRTICRSKTI